MSKWLITWINDGKYKGEQIIPENYINEAISSQMVVGANTPDDEFPDIHFANYGYGWFLQSYKGHYRVEHGGNIDGFSANVAFFPSDKIGIVVLANQNGSSVPSLVWVGRYIENIEKAEESQEDVEEDAETSNVKNTKPSHISLDYAGTYSHPGYGTFEINAKNDSLFTTINNDKIYLHHYHYDVFELIDVIDNKVDTTQYGESIKLSFVTNDTGDISDAKIKIEPAVDAVLFKRTPNSIDVDTNTLEQYTGEYDISGTSFKIFIKNEALYLFIKGQPEYELIPTAKHKFSFKTLEGFKIEFIESEDGKIKELKAIQPNGTFVAKRK